MEHSIIGCHIHNRGTSGIVRYEFLVITFTRQTIKVRFDKYILIQIPIRITDRNRSRAYDITQQAIALAKHIGNQWRLRCIFVGLITPQIVDNMRSPATTFRIRRVQIILECCQVDAEIIRLEFNRCTIGSCGPDVTAGRGWELVRCSPRRNTESISLLVVTNGLEFSHPGACGIAGRILPCSRGQGFATTECRRPASPGGRGNFSQSFPNSLRKLLGISRREEIPVAVNSSMEHIAEDRKSTRLNSSHVRISYAVFCLKKRTTPDGRARFDEE